MLKKNIRKRLFDDNAIEIRRKKSGKDLRDFESKAITQNMHGIIFKHNYFLENKDVHIAKHNRYSNYPEHSHDFIEINYCLSGKSKQVVNGKKEVLKQYDFLVMNNNTKHSLEKHLENDIVIDIIFSKEFFEKSFLTIVSENNNNYFNCLTDIYFNNDNFEYIIFRSKENLMAQEIMDQMINYHYSNSVMKNDMLKLYLPLLLSELILQSEGEIQKKNIKITDKKESLILNLLKDINDNFDNIKLSTLADKYGYNKNYLSNFIKEKTGKTFNQIKNEHKLKQFKYLLENSNMKVCNIFDKLDITDKSYFYKAFKDTYGVTPNKVKEEGTGA